MVLSDTYIREKIANGDLSIEPYNPSNVEPASVDLRLGNEFTFVSQSYHDAQVNLSSKSTDSLSYHTTLGTCTIRPGEFVLATTKERVELPDDIVANVLGRSSLGRLGVSVHQTAGYIDPGFEGQITLELSNHGPAPVELEEGLRICQIVFNHVSGPVDEPYGHEDSQYQDQSGATPSGMSFD